MCAEQEILYGDSIILKDSGSNEYIKYVINDSDSIRTPYKLNKIHENYLILQSYEIKIIDLSRKQYDIIKYREYDESGSVSPPFTHEDTLYFMKKIYDTNKINYKVYKYQL